MHVDLLSRNEGRSFAVAFSNCESPYTGRELIINARQNTMVTISTSQKSETITVYENWSVHYDYDGGTVTTDIQERGGFSNFVKNTLKSQHEFKITRHNCNHSMLL